MISASTVTRPCPTSTAVKEWRCFNSPCPMVTLGNIHTLVHTRTHVQEHCSPAVMRYTAKKA